MNTELHMVLQTSTLKKYRSYFRHRPTIERTKEGKVKKKLKC